MAAPRERCANCGELFDRRQVTQEYCMALDCRRARIAANVRRCRNTHATLLEYRHTAAISRGAA